MTPLRDAIEQTIRAYRETDPDLSRWLTESLETFDREQVVRDEIHSETSDL